MFSCFFLPTFMGNFRNRLLKYEFKPHVHFFSVLGLLLRTVCNNWSHTVYSLALNASLVYCGTKTGTIPAFEFAVSFELIQINEKWINDFVEGNCGLIQGTISAFTRRGRRKPW